MKQYLLLGVCWLAFNADGACSSDSPGQVDPVRTIALQKRQPEGSFYFRVDHYAIVVERTILTRRMEEQANRPGTLSDGRLLKDIRSVKAGGEYTDLFAFALKDPLYLPRIELLLADILERGEASVVDVHELFEEPGRFVSTAVLQESANGRRQFCTPSGDLLLWIPGEIA